MAAIAFICFGPILVLVFQSFSLEAGDRETFDFVLQQMVPGLLKNTLSLVFLTAIFSVFFGTLAATLTQMTNLPFRKFFDFMFIVPLSFPLYVLSFIYVGSLEYSGGFHTFFRETFGLNLHPYIPIKSVWGVAFVFSLGLYPYTYLFIRSGLRSSAGQIMMISRSLGKNATVTFFKVLLPILKPWLMAAAVLTAMETLADFGGVSAFNYDTFTTAIYSAWSGFFSLPTAARLSSFLIFLAVLFFLMEWTMSKKLNFAMGKKKEFEAGELWKLSLKGQIFVFLIASTLLFFSLIFPLFQLINWSIQAFEIEWSDQYYSLIYNTLKIGFIAAAITSIGALIMVSFKRLSPLKINRIFTSISLLGYSLPGNIIAVAAFIFLGLFTGGSIAPTLTILILALGIRFVAVAYRGHENTFKNLPANLEPASRSLGAGNFRIFGKVHLPLMKKSLFLGAILTFLEVIKEMPITVMLRPFEYNTLSVKIFELTVEGEWERAALAGLFLVCSGMVFSLLYAQFGGEK